MNLAHLALDLDGIVIQVTVCSRQQVRMSTWAEYQSVIQLAAALNAAFPVIWEFRSRHFETERNLLSATKLVLVEIERNCGNTRHPSARSLVSDFSARYQDIAADFDVLAARVEQKVRVWVQSACVGAFVAALALLFVASEFAGDPLHPIAKVGLAACHLPYLVFAGYYLHLSRHLTKRVVEPRRDLDDQCGALVVRMREFGADMPPGGANP
jgi:hypothetical protein